MNKVEIYDTTLRDGAQAEGVSFSLHDKLLITQRLAQTGFDYVEGGYPLSNEKDAEYFRRVQNLNLGKTKVCAFGMTRRRGVSAAEDTGMRALADSQAPAITVVGKTWDMHATEVLRVSLDENIDMIADSVAFLAGLEGREVLYDAEHYFDGSKANPDYALKTILAAARAGAKTVILCDTNGGSMPEEIAHFTRRAVETLGPLGVRVGIHCHNDCELAVANSLAAVEAGARHVQGTVNGFGERCGNANLISVIGNLGLKKKDYRVLDQTGLEHLTELSRYVYETANWRLRDDQPFVGRSAFAHKGGMHAHAVARLTSSYEHIDPQLVGNERRILVSELSGRSNIAAITSKRKLGIEDDPALMNRVLNRVCELENQGYQFEAAEASFDLLVRREAGRFQPHFERIKYHVEAGTQDGETLVTEATVKLRVGGQLRHEVAEGDGPVNALDAALRKALNDRFPGLRTMSLIDYKVRVINSEAGTAARIRVIIQGADATDLWGTIGVSENIIEASWIALIDAIEYKLYKDEVQSDHGN